MGKNSLITSIYPCRIRRFAYVMARLGRDCKGLVKKTSISEYPRFFVATWRAASRLAHSRRDSKSAVSRRL